MFSLSEENYLKAIFHLEHRHKEGVATNDLARKMDTKASSVSEMVRKLADKNLVIYKRYQGVRLSQRGRQWAIEVIRKHRLWEVFLVRKLEFSWDEVHEVAEQLEHIQSEKLTTELDRFLEFPERDPHGDPIPDSEGRFRISNNLLLSELEVGQRGVFVGVKDSSPRFLQYLDKNQISLGKELLVVDKEVFDHSMCIEMMNKKLCISQRTSNNLFVKLRER